MLHSSIGQSVIAIVLFCLLFLPAKGNPERQEKKKKGWNAIPFPIVSYNSDLGFQYGAFCELYHYGDGSVYPNYYNKISAEVSRFTKGSGVYRLYYDTRSLSDGIRLTADLSYLTDKMLDFYGFNGYKAPYSEGQNKAFYKIHRDMFRFTADLQYRLKGRWAWTAGLAYYHYQTGKIELDKYSNADNLYEQYVRLGLIHLDEAKGGNITRIKTGLVYDSRDIEGDPTRGAVAEINLCGSPDLIDRKGYSHLQVTCILRHYLPVWKDHLTFAYRAGYQSVIAGHTPFYALSTINSLDIRQTYTEGLGGTTSLRGIYRNRIAGDGIAWLNAEFRLRFFRFRLLRQNWYCVINPFFDSGMVTRLYRGKEQQSSMNPLIYTGKPERPHCTSGIGAKIIMNHNFVLSAEWGKAYDQRDGTNSINLYMNYLF